MITCGCGTGYYIALGADTSCTCRDQTYERCEGVLDRPRHVAQLASRLWAFVCPKLFDMQTECSPSGN